MNKKNRCIHFLIYFALSLAASVAISVAAAIVASGLHIGRLGPASEETRWAQSMLDILQMFFFIPDNLSGNALGMSPEISLILAYFFHVVFYALVFVGIVSCCIKVGKSS